MCGTAAINNNVGTCTLSCPYLLYTKTTLEFRKSYNTSQCTNRILYSIWNEWNGYIYHLTPLLQNCRLLVAVNVYSCVQMPTLSSAALLQPTLSQAVRFSERELYGSSSSSCLSRSMWLCRWVTVVPATTDTKWSTTSCSRAVTSCCMEWRLVLAVCITASIAWILARSRWLENTGRRRLHGVTEECGITLRLAVFWFATCCVITKYRDTGTAGFWP